MKLGRFEQHGRVSYRQGYGQHVGDLEGSVDDSHKRRARKHHHSVYVVLLSREVLYERKFVKCNPNYEPDKPCGDVCMKGQRPDGRFDQHKAGIKAKR